MNSRNLLFGAALIILGFTSCKNEREENAEKKVNTYVVYVDSLGNIPAKDAKTNWQAIDASYQMKTSEADAALADLKEKDKAQQKINASKAKYEALKAKMMADMEVEKQSAIPAETTNTPKAPGSGAPNLKQVLRNTLFGEGKIGNDMNFNWVNKDNIHVVYQQFVHTVEDNKNKYSREDWDEIKLMYEALDSRKNTVEKEGLSSKDNAKIAGLKVKFSSMYALKRLSAKSRESKEAKEDKK